MWLEEIVQLYFIIIVLKYISNSLKENQVKDLNEKKIMKM